MLCMFKSFRFLFHNFRYIFAGHTMNDNSYWKGLYLLKLRFLIAFKLPTRRKTRNTTYKLPTVENFSIRVFKDTVSSHAIIFIHHLLICIGTHFFYIENGNMLLNENFWVFLLDNNRISSRLYLNYYCLLLYVLIRNWQLWVLQYFQFK